MKKKINPFLESLSVLNEGVNDVFTKKLTNTDLLLSEIIVNSQIRKEFENKEHTLEDLTESIKIHGIIEPLVVRHTDAGYELIAGERRYKAALMAGLTSVPVTIKYVDTKAAMLMQFAENIHRKDLTLLEEAKKLEELRDEFGSAEKVLKGIGKNKFWFSRRMALLELPEHAMRLAGDKVTQDVNLIHEVRAIERVNPHAAKELVDDLIHNKGGKKARDKVAEVKRVVKAPKLTTVTKPLPVSEPQIQSVKTTETLLEKIYDDLSNSALSAESVYQHLSNDELQFIEERVGHFYEIGRSEKDRAAYVLNALRSRLFTYIDFRVFYFIAFMHGVDGKVFSVADIFTSIKEFING